VTEERERPGAEAPGPTSEAERDEKGKGISDYIKRAVLAGVGAVFMTEEGVRGFLGDLKLPKQTAQFVLNQVAKTKEDLFRIVTSEIRAFLESTQLSEELKKVLTSISLEISTKVRFLDEKNRLRPELDPKIRIVNEPRRKAKKPTREEEEPPESPDAPSDETADEDH
jgi:hypothetical protein